MKKNRMMRIASVLLVAVLITACAISGTFAKYVTTDSGSDSAQVAKFGVVIQVDGKLYSDAYGTADVTPVVYADGMSIKAASAATKILAPGAKNEDGFGFSINGTPEVATNLSVVIQCENIYLKAGTYAIMVKANNVTATSFALNTYYTEEDGAYTLATAFDPDVTAYYTMQDTTTVAADYYPVVYAADETTTIANDSLKAIADDYAAKLNGAAVQPTCTAGEYTYEFNKNYDVNFNYSSLAVADDKLTWAWAFENEGYDGADTILGQLMAGTLADAEVVKVTDTAITAPTAAAGAEANDYNLETSFSIEITVTQITAVTAEEPERT